MLHIPEDAIQQSEAVFGITPKREQLMVVEHIGRGEDCILIAGCGWGKSFIYFLPLIFWTDRIIVIISPLKVLMREQHEKLERWNISSIVLDSSTKFMPATLDELARGKYRAVFMTPELIFQSERLTSLWPLDDWRRQLLAIIVDEAHCVHGWGQDFRTSYGRLGSLRTKVPSHVAFVAVSATLPDDILKKVKEALRFDKFHLLNVGNDRPNIRFEVQYFQPRMTKFQHLEFLLDFQKTIVYFDKREDTQQAADFLRSKVVAAHRSKIAVFHALMSKEYNEMVMEQFKQDKICLLLSTEAAGMGCDISDVVRVVQFGLPKDITTLVQRLGRAARDPQLQGLGILLVSPSGVRAADQSLDQYINTKDCRRKILDARFGNVDGDRNDIKDCCDLCNPSLEARYPHPTITFEEAQSDHISTPCTRTPEQKKVAASKLKEWRSMAYFRDIKPSGYFWTESCVMDDNTVMKLAENFGKVTKPESILTILGNTWTPWKESFTKELAELLIGLNRNMDGLRMQPQPQVDQSNAVQVARTTRPMAKTIFVNTTVKEMARSIIKHTAKKAKRF